MKFKQFRLPLSVFMLTFILLAFVQVMVDRPMILAERLFKGGGWTEIFLISCWGAFVVKKMVHCIMYCPVGTIVNVFKHVNPFRMYIDQSFSLCMNCTKFCKYDALNPVDIKNSRPAFTCTLCGDCLSGCMQPVWHLPGSDRI